MSKDKSFTLLVGQLIACSNCKTVGAVGANIYPAEGEDIGLSCGSCGKVMIIKYGTPLPKVTPPSKLVYFRQVALAGSDSVPVEERNERVQTEAALGDAGGPQVQSSIHRMAERLAVTLLTGLKQVEEIKLHLDELAKAMGFQFEEGWQLGEMIKRWDGGYLNAFVQQPIIKFPVESQNKIKDYCQYVLYPRFFQGEFGLPLSSDGQFNLELMTPYTRFSGYPISEWMATFLGVPAPLRLEVLGEKIIGADIASYWRDIEGVEEDEDHTPGHASIRIRIPSLARPWLARHGVQPWQSKKSDVSSYAAGMVEKLAPDHRRVFDLLAEHGRILLNWYNGASAIEAALAAAEPFHGQKLFLSYDSATCEPWRKAVNRRDSFGGFMWHTYSEDDAMYFDLKRHRDMASMIIFDATRDPDFNMRSLTQEACEALEHLFLYSGKLIIIFNDPIGDTLYSNEDACFLHSLVAQGMCDTPPRYEREKFVQDYSQTKLLEILTRFQK